MRAGAMAALGAAALLAGCGRGTDVTTRWLTDDWAPNRECREADFLTLKRDGSYTAPMNVPNRRAIGIWSYENGALEIGTVFRMERFRIEAVSPDEMRTHPLGGGAQPGTFYRC